MVNDHKDEETIFNVAIQFESREEREAYLTEACGPDKKLRAAVEALLKAHYEAKSLLDEPVVGPEVTLGDSPLTEGPGTKIGRYKLLQMIGEGGFGVVYMAQQEEPIRRRVALKIIKLGMDTKQVIARFEAERQALAMMEHPNIAKVLDAGATDTGRPYFVMELVKGIPITEYCDKNNLDTRQRLELFIDVCKAIQHAHQKGIIHRDIKPSNVMITLRDDGTGVPKIIDFGIAKATQHELTEKTFFTEFKQFIGTPEYMSPEQAQMGELDVDTRSDIYSLGVLLYELLTGATPFEAEELRSAAYDEMLKTIRETEPPKPSTRLNTLGDALADVAKHRHVQPSELCKIIQGDLDWIVLKTLEKDRTRRYETANELVADIQRHLADEPVVAGPPSATYRLGKFVRRHRTGVVFGLLLAAALVIGLSLATIGFVQASHQRDLVEVQRDRAEENFQRARDTVNEIIRVADRTLSDDRRYKPEPLALLQKARIFYEGFLDESTDKLAIRQETGQTYSRLGDIHRSLGELEAAKQAYRQAIFVFEALSMEFPSQMNHLASATDSRLSLGYVLRWSGQSEEALKQFRLVQDALTKLASDFSPNYLLELAEINFEVGLTLVECGRFEEAEIELRKAIEFAENLEAELPDVVHNLRSFTGRCHRFLGFIYYALDRIQQAEAELRHCVDIREQVIALVPEHIFYQDLCAMAHYCLGLLLHETGRTAEAAEHFRRAIAVLEGCVDDSTGIILTPISLAAVLSTCPDLQFRNLDRALELTMYAVATDRGDAQSWRVFGICRYQIGQWEAAIAAIEKGIELRGSAHQPDWVFLAMAHLQLGNQQEAYAWYEKAKAVQWFEKTSGIGVMTMRQLRREAEELFRLVDEADAGEEEE